jgi:hypothetical protein
LFPAFSAQLNDALDNQVVRIGTALKAEKVARHEAAALRAQISAPVPVKREHEQVGSTLADGEPSAAKRQKMEDVSTAGSSGSIQLGDTLGPDIDVTTLDFDIMLELLFITLNGMDEHTIRHTIEVSIQSRSQ